MNKSFKSNFSEQMANFVAQKRALGFDYTHSEGYLYKFDKMCESRFPNETALTREICMAWASRKEGECINTFLSRLPVVREFGRFLNRIGETAYVLPAGFAPKAERHTPHIYTESEIVQLWEFCDDIKPMKHHPVRHIVIPAVMRLLYCCGLRPCEARRLCVDDVSFERGSLEILESKGHKSRTVMMSDDLNEYLRAYDTQIKLAMPKRAAFFPNSGGKMPSKNWLVRAFDNACAKTGIHKTGNHKPRIYDLRHTFATHRLYKWMNEGKDLP